MLSNLAIFYIRVNCYPRQTLDVYHAMFPQAFDCPAVGVAGAAGDCGAVDRRCSTSEPSLEHQMASGRRRRYNPSLTPYDQGS